ncbi:MAG: hypothetical protein MZW92_15135 [Comamonadaceae bacterium]|nr:hypothetical protein [Comamonadaceae bacterium]
MLVEPAAIRFRIVTKSALIERDTDLLADMARDDLVQVTFSVTTLDSDLARRMEPRAAQPQRRHRGDAPSARCRNTGGGAVRAADSRPQRSRAGGRALRRRAGRRRQRGLCPAAAAARAEGRCSPTGWRTTNRARPGAS